MSNDIRLIESHRVFSKDLYRCAPPDLREKRKGEPISLIQIINHFSAKEKSGGGRPPHWEMIFWWTRKPLIGARFVIAASLLPENTNINRLARALGLVEKGSPHRKNPDLSILNNEVKKLRGSSLLDPFAGFGSIPLEAIRLGLKNVVAIELLPTAYVFLKAVLEYPKWVADKGLGKQLLRDVKRWGEWVTQKLKDDPDIRELYDDDTAVYIGTWEILCPHIGEYTPLVGNWWLARVRGNRGYERLVYMKPMKTLDNKIRIEVVDINKMHRNLGSAIIRNNKIIITTGREKKEYVVPEPNIRAKTNTAYCLQDNTPISYIDPQTGKTYPTKEQAPEHIRQRLEFYPKHAINEWNIKIEEYLKGKIDLNQLMNTKARPKIIAKVKITKNNKLEFKPATEEDNKKLWEALEKLKDMWGDTDIPIEPIPAYESRSIWVYLYGFDKWFKLFNLRQLLTLIKLVKLIREAGKRVEEEKLKKGWSSQEAFRYAEAVTTYLAIAVANFALRNSVVSPYYAGTMMRGFVEKALTFRGISMVWNWGELNPWGKYVVGTFIRSVENQLNGLSHLVSAVSGSPSNVRVLLDDATMLTRLSNEKNEKFDTIITDPPYYDDVPYAELSDFYYVWLKRALSDVGQDKLVPKFMTDKINGRLFSPFFRRVGNSWKEITTQWEEFARKEISTSLGRLNIDRDDALEWFVRRLGAAIRTMTSHLTDNGIIITYYNHTKPDAWASLIRAGWEFGGLQVSATIPLVTESSTRVTGRGKLRLDTSVVIIWKKRSEDKVADLASVKLKALAAAKTFVNEIVDAGVTAYDILFAALGKTLSVFTKYSEIVSVKGKLSSKELVELGYRIAGEAVAEALGDVAGVKVGSSIGRFYLVTRVLFSEAREIKFDGASMGLLQIATGIPVSDLERAKVVRCVGTGRSIEYMLLYPMKATKKGIESLLSTRNLVKDPERASLRNSIDILHLLYYRSTIDKESLEKAKEILSARNRDLYEEAIAIARALCRLLPEKEAERLLACRVVGVEKSPSREKSSLEKWVKRTKS